MYNVTGCKAFRMKTKMFGPHLNRISKWNQRLIFGMGFLSHVLIIEKMLWNEINILFFHMMTHRNMQKSFRWFQRICSFWVWLLAPTAIHCLSQHFAGTRDTFALQFRPTHHIFVVVLFCWLKRYSLHLM